MSVATQITRLQGVRDQIRTKMVSLGLSENTDLLQNLADDLDGVSKITPTSSTTDPGTSYTNTTLDRSTSTRYVKIPKGYNGANTKFTVSGVPNGAYSASVSSHTVKTKPTASSSISGSITDIASTVKPTGNYYMITPSLSTTTGSVEAAGKATISTAGYIAAGSKTERSTIDVSVSATQGKDYYLRTGEYSISVSSHTTTNATASSSVSGTITGITTTTAPTSGADGTDYYTITPKLTTDAGKSKVKAKATVDTAGYIATGSKETSEASEVVSVSATQGSSYYLPASTFGSETTTNPTSSTNLKSVTPGTAAKYIPVNAGYRSAGKITVNAVPSFSFNIQPDSWESDSNATIGKYYYNAHNINITASNNLYVMPSNASKAQSFGVYAYSQSRSGDMGLLQFRAVAQPTSDLTYTVYYLN